MTAPLTRLLSLPGADQPIDPDRVGAGTLGFIVFAFLAAATVLILWFMNRSVRKVPKDLDVPTHSKRPAPLPVDRASDDELSGGPADGPAAG